MFTFRDILKHLSYQVAKEVPLLLSPLHISPLEAQYLLEGAQRMRSHIVDLPLGMIRTLAAIIDKGSPVF